MTKASQLHFLPEKRYRAIRHIVFHCGCLSDGESLLLICNKVTEQIARDIARVAENNLANVNVEVDVIPNLTIHGVEPPQKTATKMECSALTICLTRMSLAHTKARQSSSEKGGRFLSMPDFDDNLLLSDAPDDGLPQAV